MRSKRAARASTTLFIFYRPSEDTLARAIIFGSVMNLINIAFWG
jgi:hypothetical protein